jgi:hypothetical protein
MRPSAPSPAFPSPSAPVVKTLLILAVGVAIGYSYGYKDAKQHDQTVYERLIDRAGAAARGKYDANSSQQQADSVGR